MTKGSPRYTKEFRERAVRLVLDSRDEYASETHARRVIAQQLGCSPEGLRYWVRKAEKAASTQTVAESGVAPRATAGNDVQARIRELERENRDLKRSNEILRLASAFFAQAELDRLKS